MTTATPHPNPNPTTTVKMTDAQYLGQSRLLKAELDRVRGILDNYAGLPASQGSPLLAKTRSEWADVLRRIEALDVAYWGP